MNSNPDIISIPSLSSVEITITRLKSLLQERGITIYSHIDQQSEAARSGLDLSPLQLLIFGSPGIGIPLMDANPLSGLDLPLKVIVWEDDEKKVWLSYNKFNYIQKRFDLPSNLIQNLSRAETILIKAVSLE